MSHTPASAHPAGVFARAQADAEFLERVRAAYTGRADVLDALWWHDHPLEVAPSGAEAPQVLVRELQRLAYSADVDPAAHAEATCRLSAARQAVDEDRAAVERAISSADLPARGAASNISEATTGSALVEKSEQRELGHPQLPERAAHAQTEIAPSSADTGPAPRSPSTAPGIHRRGRAAWIAGGLSAALIAGLFLGTQWDGISAGLPSASPEPSADASTLGFAAIFDRTQNPYVDLPPVDLPIEFNAESSARELFHGEGSSVYAVRTRFDSVCVVAIPPELTIQASCVPAKEFPPSGLTLNWSSDAGTPHQSDQLPEIYDWTLTWLPDGTVEPALTVRAQEIGPLGRAFDPFLAPAEDEYELARLILADPATFEGSVSAVVPDDADGVMLQADCRTGAVQGSLTVEVSTEASPTEVLAGQVLNCNEATTGLSIVEPGLAGKMVRIRLVGDLTRVSHAYVILSRYNE
ncbi:hypothetical protein [Homoserinimonas sp. OAct 916]|uniref:hypothetical protein n=1 Tax=Homoserinimonas sp. OAct 916 TaxID=2211450 RepID=UPI000DBE9FA1|nr:hypothetical protein [Homoserinimonas sp. OAct 916]